MKPDVVNIGFDGRKHFTSADLLMFDSEYDIVREYDTYFRDYHERYCAGMRRTDYIISSSGELSCQCRYYGRQEFVVIKKRDSVTMFNPNSFRIEIDAAKKRRHFQSSQRSYAENIQYD